MGAKKLIYRSLAVAATAAAGVAVFSTAAFAGVGASTPGASMYCNTYNDGGGYGHADCTLTDTSADSHSVYAVMQVDGFPSHRYNNTGGASTTLSYTDHFYSDVVHWDYHYKVCRNVQFGSDNCSGWIHIRS